MDGQNFQNGQNTTSGSVPPTNYYQDYTTNTNSTQLMYEQPKQNNTPAVVSLVMGILAIIFSCCCGLGIIFGIIGIICAIVSKKNGKSGIAIAGLVCSIIGAVFSIAVIAYFIYVYAFYSANPNYLDEIYRYYY